MSLKFGKIFQDMIGVEWGKLTDKVNSQIAGVDISNLKSANKELNNLNKEAKELSSEADHLAKSIRDVEEEMAKGTLTGARLAEAEHDLKILRDEADKLEKKRLANEKKALDFHKKREKDVQDLVKDNSNAWDKWSGHFTDAQDQFEKQTKSLIEQFDKGTIDTNELVDAMEELKFNRLFSQIKQLSSMDDNEFGRKAVDAFGDTIADGLGKLGPIGQIVGSSISAVVTRLNEMNKALIDLQRSTGGLATAAKLGFDQFGNAKRGAQSLTTQLAAANVNMEEFSASMKSLFSGSLGAGQVAGLKDDLSKSGEALKEYGIEAARMAKMYGADIGPAVSNMMSNFGMGIKDSTKLVKEGADTARSLGLSVKAFTNNLQQATELAGQFYFKTAEQMTKLAGLATQLGTSVNAIAGGVVQMNGITGLFEQQQKVASLGLQTLGKNLSKVYALRQTGKGAEAAQLELSSLAKDLKRNGLTDKTGQVTQQGISTLQAGGASQEQIQAIQKMARNAEKAGVALDKAFDPASLSKEEKKRLAAVERQGMTVEEQLSTTFGKLKGAILDPIAKVIGPLLALFGQIVSAIGDVVVPILNILGDALATLFSPIRYIQEEIGAIIDDVFTPLKAALSNIAGIWGGFFDVIKSVAKFVIKFLMIPFRIIGKVIGGIIDIFATVFGVIKDALAPAFEWLADLFDGGSEMLDGLFSTIGEVFGWLADFIGGALKAVFTVLGKIIGFVVGAMKAVWEGLVWLWEVLDEYIITPIVDFLAPVFEALGDLIDWLMTPFNDMIDGIAAFIDWLGWFDDEPEQTEITPDDWKQILGTDGVAEVAKNNPTAPNANEVAQTQQEIYAKGSEAQRMNEEALQKALGMVIRILTNQTNVFVDPMFGTTKVKQ